jgi:hypothetical protein
MVYIHLRVSVIMRLPVGGTDYLQTLPPTLYELFCYCLIYNLRLSVLLSFRSAEMEN